MAFRVKLYDRNDYVIFQLHVLIPPVSDILSYSIQRYWLLKALITLFFGGNLWYMVLQLEKLLIKC